MSEEESGAGPMLLAACKRGNLSLLNQLIEEYKDKLQPNLAIDGLGNAPLHYAATGDHRELAEILFSKYPDIDPNIQNFAGDTALHKAAEKDYIEFLKLLLEHGADSTLANKKGRTAQTAARSTEARQAIKAAQVAAQMALNKAAAASTTATSSSATSASVVVNTADLPVVRAELDASMAVDAEDDDE